MAIGWISVALGLFAALMWLLFASALPAFDVEALGDGALIAIGVVVCGLAVLALRRVSHRFEHEADVLSAIALGGAEPCIRALQRVGQAVRRIGRIDCNAQLGLRALRQGTGHVFQLLCLFQQLFTTREGLCGCILGPSNLAKMQYFNSFTLF